MAEIDKIKERLKDDIGEIIVRRGRDDQPCALSTTRDNAVNRHEHSKEYCPADLLALIADHNRQAKGLAAKDAEIERLKKPDVRMEIGSSLCRLGLAPALAAADALRDFLLTKHVEDGKCPVCGHSADGLNAYFHADTCLIAAYDATRRPHLWCGKTPTDRDAEIANALAEVAKAYELWEGDLIENGDWSQGTVRLTQDQHDRMIEIQTMRNHAVALYDTTLPHKPPQPHEDRPGSNP